ncbi:MAG: fluoride efflux transporter CrcB [Pseudomonadota bacterium]|nr:fluoride efflux transporter CrcB [Pseudomonadota bacterium]
MVLTWKLAALLACGGALGTLARFALAQWAAPISVLLPWGTILINVCGSLLIGVFATLTFAGGRLPLGEDARLFVMVGFCGGFTTFSAFSLQTLDLLREGEPLRALGNVLISVLACLAAVAAGHYAAVALNGGRAGPGAAASAHESAERA